MKNSMVKLFVCAGCSVWSTQSAPKKNFTKNRLGHEGVGVCDAAVSSSYFF